MICDLSFLSLEIQLCYRLFSPRRPKKTDLRSHNWKELEDLRSLTWEALEERMPETVVYVGGEDEFRELLPRFFELAWEQANDRVGLDMVSLYPLGCLLPWPVHERAAIEACFLLLWRLALRNEDSFGLRDILWTLQNVEISWLPFLNDWLQSPISTSAFAPAISFSRWDDLPAEVRHWLCQKAIFERIQTDFFAAQDDDTRTAISEFEKNYLFMHPLGSKPRERIERGDGRPRWECDSKKCLRENASLHCCWIGFKRLEVLQHLKGLEDELRLFLQ